MQIQNAYLTHNRPKTRRSRTTAIAVHWVAENDDPFSALDLMQ